MPCSPVCFVALVALAVVGAQPAGASGSRTTTHLHWVQTLAVKEGDRDRCLPPKFSGKELGNYFFRDAKRVPEEGFAHRDWSICYAVGYATAAGRHVLRWELNLLGTGTLTWSDGRKEFFACEDCTALVPR